VTGTGTDLHMRRVFVAFSTMHAASMAPIGSRSFMLSPAYAPSDGLFPRSMAIDAQIPNGHDDPLNFDIDSFARSLDSLMVTLRKDRPGSSLSSIALPSRQAFGLMPTLSRPKKLRRELHAQSSA
jgi:hypothetical protein